MPTPTYTPLANITLDSSAASVSFSSISQAYRDLVLVINATNTVTNGILYFQVNGDTGNNYNHVRMVGNGSTATSATGSSVGTMLGGYYGLNRSMQQLSFFDFSAIDKHKTVLVRSDDASQNTVALAGRWASTSAITSILVYASANSFAAGSSFCLYGIAA